MKLKENCTLQCIAKALNVHVSTISRVLSGDEQAAKKAASEELIKKIREKAQQCNYIPNSHAKSLRKQQSFLIGVIVPQLSDFIWASMYEGVEQKALEKGYAAYVTNSYEKQELRTKQLSIAMSRNVGGLVIGDSHIDERCADFLDSISLPFVLAIRHTGKHLSVTCDDVEGGRLVAKHLFERGHRYVGLLPGLEYTSTGYERSIGFINYYKEAGFALSEDRIVYSSFHTEGGYKGAKQLLQKHPEITAIYATNDIAAIGAMGAIREAGLVTGESIALVGYNDTPLAGTLSMPLTTVQSPIHEIGRAAMDLLLKRMMGEPCESIVFKPQLIVRDSSCFMLRA